MMARRHEGMKARGGWWSGVLAVTGAMCAGAAASDEFVLIDAKLNVHEVRVVEINDLMLAYQDAEGMLQTSSIGDSIALIRQLPDAVVRRSGAGPLPLPVPWKLF